MIFCKNPDADVPILELYDVIGVFKDEYGVPNGISGQEFADYIKFIEGQGKKGIDIYINSEGGSIIEGMTIIAAIKSCTIPVNTICVGVAVSMAGVILQVGKVRKMVKEGLMMIHPPSGGDEKSLKALKGALLQYLYPRTNLTEDEVEALMDETSWLDAKTCLEMKLIDEIVDISSVANAQESKKIENKAVRLKKIVNQLTETKPVTQTSNNMEINKLKNQLNLNGDATENQVVESVKNLQNSEKRANKAVENALKEARKMQNKNADADEDEDTADALKKEMSDLKKAHKANEDKIKDLEDKLNKKDTECEDLKHQNEDLKNAGNKAEAEAAIDEAIKAGKIKAEVKNKFVDLYLADKDETVALLDGITVNKAAAKMPIESSKFPKKPGEPAKNASNEVLQPKGGFLNKWKRKATSDFETKTRKA